MTGDELIAIKQDISNIKFVLKQIRKNTKSLKTGFKGWFDHFDKDKSDKIELNEFVDMIHYLNIEMDDRLGIMLFRLFDR